MPVSKDLLNAKLALIKLKTLSQQMAEVSEVVEQLKGLTTILKEEAIGELILEIKTTINDSINQILDEVLEEAGIHATASEMEVNTKIKFIAPIIAGIPVILPAPTEYAAEELETIVLATSIGADFIEMNDNFKKSMDQWHL